MNVIRLTSADADRFLAFRASGLTRDPGSFRFVPADDVALGMPFWSERLDRDVVVAAVTGDVWLGIGGFTRLGGTCLNHKGLIWGMYVAPEARGTGVADDVMNELIECARGSVRQLQLTVMAANERARAFYERHGFRTYAIEPESVRYGNNYADEALMLLHL